MIAREEQLHAQQILSGKADAGQREEPKEESDTEYSQRLLAGDVEQ